MAQSTSSTPAPAARASSATNVKGVTVTGTPPPVRSSIDRRSYDITKDLNATTGTVADVLRSVPALSVDLQGTVSIRGDSNVVIMVDGKPSTLFQGPGRAQALQSMPADEYERVEVITNPSAAFSPEGTGGIVNLISKKTRKPGRSGSVRVNADPTGRWNAGVSASQKTDKLTLSVNGGVRRDLQAPTTVEMRDGFATPTEPAFTSVTTTDAPSRRDSWTPWSLRRRRLRPQCIDAYQRLAAIHRHRQPHLVRHPDDRTRSVRRLGSDPGSLRSHP